MKISNKTGTKNLLALTLIMGLIFQFCCILLPQDIYAEIPKEPYLKLTLPMEEYQFFELGETIKIKGVAENISELLLKITDPDRKEIFSTELDVVDKKFEFDYEIPNDAKSGKHKIVLIAPEFEDKFEFRFLVNIDKSENIYLTFDDSDEDFEFDKGKLESMVQVQNIYSTINDWPTKKWYIAEGVRLEDILDEADVNPEKIKTITFKTQDNWTVTFTKQELFEDRRFCFPKLDESSDEGRYKVDTIISLKSAQIQGHEIEPEKMNDSDGFRIFMGQRALTEQTNAWHLKFINRIIISSEEPEKWDAVYADPPPGVVKPGTGVFLNHPNFDQVRIYYTLDGSEPDVNSEMFNISRTYFQPHLNKPIEIEEDTAIKAIVIAPGKYNSDVVEFKYKLTKCGGPVLTWTDDPTTSQTITWLLPNTVSRAKIQYMIAEDFRGNFDEAQYKEINGEKFGQDYNCFSAQLSQLSPNTEYVYRIENKGSWGEPCYFRTAAQTDKFSFIYLGDTQQEPDMGPGYDHLKEILYSAYDGNQSLALFGGDLTDNGGDEDEWLEFINSISGVSSQIPIMPTMGNHDGSCYLDFFNLPANGPEGLKKRFYSFDYGDAHFVILDSNNNASSKAREWLRNDLENTSKKWKFAVFHHPAYPTYLDPKTEMQARSIQENWVPILEQNGIDMVFGGHQHMYMRTYPIKDGQVFEKPEDGVIYIMGNASPKTYQNYHDSDYIAEIESGSNFQTIEIDNDILTFTSTNMDGEVMDTYIIDKRQDKERQYELKIEESDDYVIQETESGMMLTLKQGVTGFKHFGATVKAAIGTLGQLEVVFTHLRNNAQQSLNSIQADFDAEKINSKTGFNTEPGDVIKIYMVDELTNGTDRNPVILQ